jgi:hypothetical protein
MHIYVGLKKSSASQKKPKIDLWKITGCAQIQEIERPAACSSPSWIILELLFFNNDDIDTNPYQSSGQVRPNKKIGVIPVTRPTHWGRHRLKSF